MLEQGTFKIKGYDGPIVECDKCGADMHLKLGRFGNIWAVPLAIIPVRF
ncbi:DNA topoisomerase I [Actinobacillus equuli]|nr:DNA topoisomerase I [Actinobacillus equuli]